MTRRAHWAAALCDVAVLSAVPVEARQRDLFGDALCTRDARTGEAEFSAFLQEQSAPPQRRHVGQQRRCWCGQSPAVVPREAGPAEGAG